MIVYRCDRCKKDIDLGVSAFDGEECLALDIKPYNYPSFNPSRHYMLCKNCSKEFKDFMNGLEVVMP